MVVVVVGAVFVVAAADVVDAVVGLFFFWAISVCMVYCGVHEVLGGRAAGGHAAMERGGGGRDSMHTWCLGKLLPIL